MEGDGDQLHEAVNELTRTLRWFRETGTVRRATSVTSLSGETLRTIDRTISGDIFSTYDLSNPDHVRVIADACLLLVRASHSEIQPLLQRSLAGIGPGRSRESRSDLAITLNVLPDMTDQLLDRVLDLRLASLREQKQHA